MLTSSAITTVVRAALNSMTNTFVRYELGDNNPTVLSMHPGWVKTEIGRASCRERV